VGSAAAFWIDDDHRDNVLDEPRDLNRELNDARPSFEEYSPGP